MPSVLDRLPSLRFLRQARGGMAEAVEIGVVVALMAGVFTWRAVQWAMMPGPATSADDAGLLAMMADEAWMMALAAGVLAWRGWRIGDLGLRPCWRTTGQGLGLAVVVQGIGWLAGALADLADTGSTLPDPVAETESETLAPEGGLSLPVVAAFSAMNAFHEEALLSGYLLAALRRHGPAVALGVSGLVRVAYHVYQGPTGALSVLVAGTVLSVWSWRTRRTWPAIVAHATTDLVGLAWA